MFLSISQPTMEAPEPVRAPSKQKKADKLYERREALLASKYFPPSFPIPCHLDLITLSRIEITAGVSPYSKSHNRRIKKLARPSENLVTNLSAVDDVLQEMKAQEEVDEDDSITAIGREVVSLPGGKGKEKLTAKKRQRVL